MTKPGIYIHAKTRNSYRVLHCARWSTNGPDEGKLVVVYLSLKYGSFHTRFEDEFNEKIDPHPDFGFNPGAKVPRFMFSHELTMSDADAESLYDGLREMFGGNQS